MKILNILLFLLVSCSDESVGVKGPDVIEETKELNLSLDPLPTYVRDNEITLTGSAGTADSTIYIYTNSATCENNKLRAYDKTNKLQGGISFLISQNTKNIIYYKVERENGEVIPCSALTQVIHDDIVPNPVSINNSVLISNFKTNQSVYNLDFQEPRDSETHKLRFYSDSLGQNLLNEVLADLYYSSSGGINLPLNQMSTIYVSVLDLAGNESILIGPLNFTHDNIAPNPPGYTQSTIDSTNEIITSASVNIQGTLDPDVNTVHMFTSFFQSTPTQIISRADFLSGVNINLTQNQYNSLYFAAIDDIGNRSNLSAINFYHDSSPTYTYNLAQTDYTYSSDLAVNYPHRVSFYLINGSTDNRYGFPVSVSSLSVSESVSELNLISSDCTSNSLAANSSCELIVEINYSSPGAKTANITVNLDGTNVPVALNFNIADPKIDESVNSQAQSSGSINFNSPWLINDYIVTNNSLYDLGNLSSIITDVDTYEAVTSGLIISDYKFYPCLNGVCWSDNSNSGVISATPGLTPSRVRGEVITGGYAFFINEASQDKVVITDNDFNIQSSSDLSVKEVKKFGTDIYFIADDLELYNISALSLNIVTPPGLGIDYDSIVYHDNEFYFHGTLSSTSGVYKYSDLNGSATLINTGEGIDSNSALNIKSNNRLVLQLQKASGETLSVIEDGTLEEIRISTESLSLSSLEVILSNSSFDLYTYLTDESGSTRYIAYKEQDEGVLSLQMPTLNFTGILSSKNGHFFSNQTNLYGWQSDGTSLGSVYTGNIDEMISCDGLVFLIDDSDILYFNTLDSSTGIYYNISDLKVSEKLNSYCYDSDLFIGYVNTSDETKVIRLDILL